MCEIRRCIKGSNAGRVGRVVSDPAPWNLWHLIITLNVEAKPSEITLMYGTGSYGMGLISEAKARRWIRCWRWNTEPADET